MICTPASCARRSAAKFRADTWNCGSSSVPSMSSAMILMVVTLQCNKAGNREQETEHVMQRREDGDKRPAETANRRAGHPQSAKLFALGLGTDCSGACLRIAARFHRRP